MSSISHSSSQGPQRSVNSNTLGYVLVGVGTVETSGEQPYHYVEAVSNLSQTNLSRFPEGSRVAGYLSREDGTSPTAASLKEKISRIVIQSKNGDPDVHFAVVDDIGTTPEGFNRIDLPEYARSNLDPVGDLVEEMSRWGKG